MFSKKPYSSYQDRYDSEGSRGVTIPGVISSSVADNEEDIRESDHARQVVRDESVKYSGPEVADHRLIGIDIEQVEDLDKSSQESNKDKWKREKPQIIEEDCNKPEQINVSLIAVLIFIVDN